MPTVAVHVVPSHASLPADAQDHLATALAHVRERAYSLFQLRGGEPGHDLEDWLAAEREILDVPAAAVTSGDGQFSIALPAAGFTPEDLHVELLPEAILIHGHAESQTARAEGNVEFEEFRSLNLFRRFPTPQPFDESAVSATLEDGVLHILAGRKPAAREDHNAHKAKAAG